MKISKKARNWILGVVVFLLALHLSLPFILVYYVNKTLKEIPGHTGSVEWIHVNLFRGAYQIHDIEILTIEENTPEPFFESKTIDLSLEWKALFDGEIAGEIILGNPVLNFVVASDSSVEAQTGEDVDWTKPIKELMPLQINRFQIDDGLIHYYDVGSDPKVDIYTTNIELLATNLSNTEHDARELPSDISASAVTIGSGKVRLDGQLNLLQKVPSFDIDASIEDINLTDLNDFILAYMKADLESGSMNFYAEFSGAEGQFDGYVKPLISELKFVKWKNDKDKPLQLIWESIIGTLAEIFENQKKDQFATKVPISGTYEDLTTNVLKTIAKVLENAFIDALKPETDNTIELKDAKKK